MIRVVIVGSEAKYWTLSGRMRAYRVINKILNGAISRSTGGKGSNPEYVILISGGCPKGGIDLWAEAIATILGIECDIKEPEVNQWPDLVEPLYKIDHVVTMDDFRSPMMEGIGPTLTRKRGYKSRNIEMAESGDVVYCLDPSDRNWSGGKWTANYARDLGKEVHYISVDNEE